jgi:LysR family nitrogen assimilation transcriptional regulator
MYFCGHDASGRVRALLQSPSASTPSARPDIDFAAAAEQPLVLQSRRYSIRQQVEDAAAQRGTALNIVHEHDSARVIRSLYACGAGFTFTPACAMGDTPAIGTDWLVARVVNPQMTRAYTLAAAPGRDGDAGGNGVMLAVVQALTEVAQRLVSTGRWDAEVADDPDPGRDNHQPD